MWIFKFDLIFNIIELEVIENLDDVDYNMLEIIIVKKEE